MYICLECGRTFMEAKYTRHTHSELDGAPSECMLACPICYDGNYEEACQCENCGEIIGESQATYYMCPECERETESKFEELLKANFTPYEIKFLNHQYEGSYFGEE